MIFRMRLASDLGRTVDELNNSMSAEEYQQWKSFRTSRPFNTAELQRAFICYILSSSHGGTASVDDFMVTKPTEDISEEEVPLEGKALDHALKGLFT